MPSLLSKTKENDLGIKNRALFFFLWILALSIPYPLRAQNLISNPSFENYTGKGEPCSSGAIYLLNNNKSSDRFLAKLNDSFPGWNFTYVHSHITCNGCNKELFSKINNISFTHKTNGYNVFNPTENMVKGGQAKFGKSSYLMNYYLDDNSKRMLESGFVSNDNTPLGRLSGRFKEKIIEGKRYYFSVWLSPAYSTPIHRGHNTWRNGFVRVPNVAYSTSDFGFNLLKAGVVDSAQALSNSDLPFRIDSLKQYLLKQPIEWLNPADNVIQGNKDSNWVELRFVFTASRSTQDFMFGLAYRDSFRIERVKYNTKYELLRAYEDTAHLTRYDNHVLTYADGFTLLPYPELGDTLYLKPGEFVELAPQVPGARLSWFNGDSSATQKVYCPGTYWVRSHSAFSSVSDSVVVRYKGKSLVDTTLCQPNARIELPQVATDIQWAHGPTDSIIYPQQEGSYAASYTLPGGCTHQQEFQVEFDTLYLPQLTDTSLCDSGSISFVAQPGHSYRWSNGQAGTEAFFRQAGEYQLTVAHQSCVDSLSLEVAIEPLQGLSRDDSILCYGKSFQLEVPWRYDISYLSGYQQEYTDSADIIFSWQQPVCGEQVDTFRLRFKDCGCTPYIPNAFSPNDDGLNEGFKPMLSCELEMYHLRIFNRWGQMVFSSENPEENWRPKETMVGVYYYILSYRSTQTLQSQFEHGAIKVLK